MRLSTGKKRVVYQLIALGTRPCEIQRRFNEQFPAQNGEKPLARNQVADYCKRFKSLSAEEQISYLPSNMSTSFALQEVRINDDIKDLQDLNEELEKPGANVIEIIRAKLSIKNRIAQELGQVRAFAKGGMGNLNILQMQINRYRTTLNKVVDLDPDDRRELLRKINMAQADVKANKQ